MEVHLLELLWTELWVLVVSSSQGHLSKAASQNGLGEIAPNEWLILFKKDINRLSDKCEIFNLEIIIHAESDEPLCFNSAAAGWPVQNLNNFLVFRGAAIGSNHESNKYTLIGTEMRLNC